MLLEIKNLFFSHRPDLRLFHNFNLKVEEGKIIALAGESGCGKSTLLNLIYGLLEWEKGTIIFNGSPILGPTKNLVPGEENMKLVAQNYDLMPYSTVADNVGKFISNINLEEKKERIQELLKVVGLEEFENTLPKYLSGGQMQRVAIARALSVMPKLLLLDEPFSNIDFSRKIELRERLFNYVREKNISLLISTHEIQEVMPWLDQIIVLQEGRLIQNDNAEETYNNPYNEYVAKLFGEVNVFSDEEKKSLNLKKNFWYPHEIKITDDGKEVEVLESRFSGSHFWTKVSMNGKKLIIYTPEKVENLIKINL
ncbi:MULTISPECIES: sulfate/molybdate ABC transporter ATP-binding protein [unclassified Kaistella]|uniref:sulfate/molybdate ABC transporter ATP-binding protein n=1 Tax=unclassified Kaistella TaxID=2762626 RepID=UPI002735942F|nr:MULTISPECIES: ABC transporter ATP-binding protein [unclassified Kaistella]MDP2453407.1 ABC transporter ATP-binding protein [Kaistella sp. SH11-4b]MDP2456464.1 ABC transporter ATP-binding protein [Kaistella sp. SH40-3]MDP2459220.1 ABC transporter ATP-binding protein [Kaistella sp. SH19-2b]